jgi:hypothetical protein
MALVKELVDGFPSITIIIHAISFGKYYQFGSMMNPMGWLNMKQNITQRLPVWV